MATETLYPDGTVFTTTGLSGGVTQVDEAPNNDWLTTNASNSTLRASFPTPSGNLNTGTGLQTFRIYVRKDATGGGDPTVDIHLYENGTDLGVILTDTAVSTATGTWVTATWDASSLTNVDGSNVEIYCDGTKGGGGPNERNIEFDSIEWIADYDGSTTIETEFGTVEGSATVTGSSDTIFAGTGSSTVSITVTGNSTSFNQVEFGTVEGQATVTGNSASTNASELDVSGSATTTGLGAYIIESAFSDSGTATVSGVGDVGENIKEVDADSTGQATVSGVATSTHAVVLSASGSATINGTSSSNAETVGASSGLATVTGISSNTVEATGASSSVASINFIAAPIIPRIALSLSSNIAAGGEDTTPQLTPPAGKTTDDFDGGRIQDDENPGDAVDVTLGGYREDEWSLVALPAAENLATYEFRVLIDGVPADADTSGTPAWTIDTGSTAEEADGSSTGQAATNWLTDTIYAATFTVTFTTITSGLTSNIASSSLSSTGTATVSGNAVAIRGVVAIAAGTATTSYQTTATIETTFNVAGIATVLGSTTSSNAAESTVTGSATVVGVGASLQGVTASSAGSATSAGLSESIAQVEFSVSGSSSVSGQATDLNAEGTDATALGSATVLGYTEQIQPTVFSASGLATVTGVATSTNETVGSSIAQASVTGISEQIQPTVFSSTGQATVTGVSGGTNTEETVGSSAGIATVLGYTEQVQPTVFSASGLATVTGIAQADAETSFTVSGLATVTGVATSTNETEFNVTGQATVLGQATDTAATGSDATATGQATVAGLTEQVQPTVFSSTAQATVSGDTETIDVEETVFNVSGLATVTGLTEQIQPTVFSASGLATVTGIAQANIATQYSVTAQATVTGLTDTIFAAVFSSTGQATVTGITDQTEETVGSSSGVATVTGVSEQVQPTTFSVSGSASVIGEVPSGTPVEAEFSGELDLTTSLQEYFEFDEASGNRVGGLNSSVLVESAPIETQGGVSGLGTKHDSNEYLHKTPAGIIGGGEKDFAVGIWTKLDPTATSTTTLMGNLLTNSTADMVYYTQLGSTGRYVVALRMGAAVYTVTDNTYTVPDRYDWNLVVFQFDSTARTVSISANGTSFHTSSTLSSNLLVDGTLNRLCIGGAYQGTTNKVGFDKAYFWDRLLTEAECLKLFNAGNGLDSDQLDGTTGWATCRARASRVLSAEASASGQASDNIVILGLGNGVTEYVNVPGSATVLGESAIVLGTEFAASAPLYDTAIAHWEFEEGSTSGLRYDSINNYDLTSSRLIYRLISAVIGQGIYTDSNGEYLYRATAGDLSINPTDTISGSFWITVISDSAIEVRLFGNSFSTSPSLATAYIRTTATDDIEFTVYNTGNTPYTVSQNANIRSPADYSTWDFHLIAFTWNPTSNQLRLSVNGQPFSSTTLTGTAKDGSNVRFTLCGLYDGHSATEQWWDHVFWWKDRELTDSDASFLYNGGNGRTLTDLQNQVLPTGYATVSGDSESAIATTAFGIGEAYTYGYPQVIAGSEFSSTGQATVSGEGEDGNYSEFSSVGQATVIGQAATVSETEGSSTGQATVTGEATTLRDAEFTVVGQATVSGDTQSSIEAVFNVTGQATTNWEPYQFVDSEFSASGVASVTFLSAGIQEATFSSIGAASANFLVTDVAAAGVDADTTGSATVTGISGKTAPIIFNSIGSASTNFIVSSTNLTEFTVTGTAVVTGYTVDVIPTEYNVNGIATVTGIAESLSGVIATSTGSATVIGIAAAIACTEFYSAGSATAIAYTYEPIFGTPGYSLIYLREEDVLVALQPLTEQIVWLQEIESKVYLQPVKSLIYLQKSEQLVYLQPLTDSLVILRDEDELVK